MLVASSFGGLIGSNLKNSIYLDQKVSFFKPVYVDESVMSWVKIVDSSESKRGTRLTLVTNVYGIDENRDVKDIRIKGTS